MRYRRILTAWIAAAVVGGGAVAAGPVRLPSGEPLIGAYFFTRWWEPWKSSDQRILDDLALLRRMGISTVFIDHEPSQMFDGDWAGLDRDHRLARQAGIGILPWLEAKNGKDVSTGSRFDEVERRWGIRLRHAEKQDGTPFGTQILDPAFPDYMVSWISDYLDRYSGEGAILRVMRDGRECRVVSPCVEMGWEGLSFDEGTNARFREWVRARYGSIEAVNEAWGTSYGAFGEIDPRDVSVFDYSKPPEMDPPAAVEDHVRFRAELTRDVFAGMSARLKERYPDLLLAAEFPYEFGYLHPHAIGYRRRYAAIPTMAEWADLLVLRSGGLPSQESLERIAAFTGRTGIPVILAHRTSSRQGPGAAEPAAEWARRYAEMSARYAAGLGYYSWNEMVDTHISRNYPLTHGAEKHFQTAEQERRHAAWVARINQAYLDRVGVSLPEREEE